MESTDLLRSALYAKKAAVKKPVLDAAGDAGESPSGAASYADADISLAAAAAVQQWAESDDLDEGEGYADRLLALMVGIADANKDGDITDDEQEVIEAALNSAWDYLVKFGVTDDDASSLLNDWDEDAAVRVRDLVLSALPEGEDAADSDINNFVFGSEGEEMALDAAYKMKVAVRGGRKVRIRKRVSGTVRLSAKQKMSIRKARMKSHSAGAMMHRMKSMRMRKKIGI